MSFPAIFNRDVLLKNQTEHFTIEDFFRLLNACNTKYGKGNPTTTKEYNRDRDALLLETLWHTGARVGDVVNLSIRNFDTMNKKLQFYVQKRKKNHTISLESDYIIHLQNFKEKWNVQGYLFVSNKMRTEKPEKQKPITTRQVERIIKEYGKIAGIETDLHPHLFRHSIAVHMVKNQVPLDVVAYQLCHASVATTTGYYARIDEDIAANIIYSKMKSVFQ